MYVVTFTDTYGIKCIRGFNDKSRCAEWLSKFGNNAVEFTEINVFKVYPDNYSNWGSSQLINPTIELEVVTTEKKVWNL